MPSQLLIETATVSSREGYREHFLKMQSEYALREHYERSLTRDTKPFSVSAYCYPCRKEVQLRVSYEYSYVRDGVRLPNWREHLVCPHCRLNNRMRASLHLFEQIVKPGRNSSLYISEQVTLLYRWLTRNYRDVRGSEYMGTTIPFGSTDKRGIRNESITHLSFPPNEFDCVLSFDVFEHVPNVQQAFHELHRVLKPDATLFFTVPFDRNAEKNILRARKSEDGKIEHLLPPEYHGDPLNSEGCLAFHWFGWEMVGQLKEAGFSRVNAHLYWSREFGYLGNEQMVFVAGK